MELFSELYGCYYNVIGQILRQAHEKGLTKGEINTIIQEGAFSESGLHLLPKLLSGEWDLLREVDGRYYSKLEHCPKPLPLSHLQAAWLKALLTDRRIHLFLEEGVLAELEQLLEPVSPLFESGDFHIFDGAADADPYDDPEYVQRFHTVLAALKQHRPLHVEYASQHNRRATLRILPETLLYSEKDDKFRLTGRAFSRRHCGPVLLNLARITAVEPVKEQISIPPQKDEAPLEKAQVTVAITNQRNALERCMLQFASYDKQTWLDEATGNYICQIAYNPQEETELVIRLLSFGPAVEVLAPPPFRHEMQERIRRQLERILAPM